jgi:hypothetical protein
MSYTTLYKITPSGRISEYAEFKNSHRGAMLVWCNVYKCYLPERIEAEKLMNGFEPHGPFREADYKALWPLFRDVRLPDYVRAVLGSTYDRVVLEKKYFQRFYDDVLKYAGMFEAGTMIEQAQSILRLRGKKVFGVCWNQTSVGSGFWHKGNIHKVDGPWSLYGAIDRISAGEKGGEA